MVVQTMQSRSFTDSPAANLVDRLKFVIEQLRGGSRQIKAADDKFI